MPPTCLVVRSPAWSSRSPGAIPAVTYRFSHSDLVRRAKIRLPRCYRRWVARSRARWPATGSSGACRTRARGAGRAPGRSRPCRDRKRQHSRSRPHPRTGSRLRGEDAGGDREQRQRERRQYLHDSRARSPQEECEGGQRGALRPFAGHGREPSKGSRIARRGDLRRRRWFARHGSPPITEVPMHWQEGTGSLVERRIAVIESDRHLGLIVRPECKRRWPPWVGTRCRPRRCATACWTSSSRRISGRLPDAAVGGPARRPAAPRRHRGSGALAVAAGPGAHRERRRQLDRNVQPRPGRPADLRDRRCRRRQGSTQGRSGRHERRSAGRQQDRPRAAGRGRPRRHAPRRGRPARQFADRVLSLVEDRTAGPVAAWVRSAVAAR